MLIFNHKSKDIAPYLVYTNDDNFILSKDDIGRGADPSDTVPAMDGIGAIGISDKYARADHVHPSELPAVSIADNGKVLGVKNGQWALVTPGVTPGV